MAKRKDQTDLAKWTSGFFDGDGMINVDIKKHEGLTNNFEIRTRCRVSQAYASGFFDAEGSISARVEKSSESAIGYNLAPAVVTSQVDNPSLQKFCTYCEQLSVSYSEITQNREGNRNPVEKITIYTAEDVRVFLEAIKPHLAYKKRQAKIMLEDILPIIERGDHTNRRGFLKAMKYIDEMNSHKGGNRGKYNLEYFEELWGMSLE